jgi:3-oxoacid CoA-transferase
MDKVVASPDDAVADIPDGATLAITGFGRWHRFPRSLTAAIADKGVKDLEIACLVLDPANGSRGGYGLVANGQVRKLIAAFASRAGERSAVDEKIYSGELAVEMVSMGVLVERLRAGGSKIPAFYTRTGVGTELAEGKEIREFDGEEYVLEKALHVDYAFLQAWRADRSGNVQFRGASLNINPVCAKAARVAIVEVQEIVEVGEIAPEDVDLPGIYVDRIVLSTVPVTSGPRAPVLPRRDASTGKSYLGKQALTRSEMAQWTAAILKPGYVNLGAGLPTLVSNYIDGRDVVMHSENGLMGYGRVIASAGRGDTPGVDEDLYNASGNYVAINDGAAFFDTVEAFAMARSGKVNTIILGAFQVDEEGNLANWKSPQMAAGGIGGAMDLAAADTELIILVEQLARDGSSKLMKQCTFPLTARRCVDVIVTDTAVFRWHGERFALERLAPGFTVDDVRQITDMAFDVSPDLVATPA